MLCVRLVDAGFPELRVISSVFRNEQANDGGDRSRPVNAMSASEIQVKIQVRNLHALVSCMLIWDPVIDAHCLPNPQVRVCMHPTSEQAVRREKDL